MKDAAYSKLKQLFIHETQIEAIGLTIPTICGIKSFLFYKLNIDN